MVFLLSIMKKNQSSPRIARMMQEEKRDVTVELNLIEQASLLLFKTKECISNVKD